MCLRCSGMAGGVLACTAAGPAVERLDAAERKGPADVILRNAAIVTMNPRRPTAEAMSIRRGFVQSLGSLAEVMPHRARMTRLVDLGGRHVVPGLVGSRLATDPADLFDWIDLDAAGALGRPGLPDAASVSTSQALFVRVAGAGAELLGRLPAAAAMPLSVSLSADGACYLNPAMAERLPAAIADRARGDWPGGFVARIDIALLAAALQAAGWRLEVRRMAERAIARSARAGFTAVRERNPGALGGLAELRHLQERAAARHRLRIHATATEALRRQSGRAIAPSASHDALFRFVAASIDLPAPRPCDRLREEVAALEAEGFEVEFDVREAEGFHQAIDLASGIGSAASRRRRRIISAHRPDAAVLRGLGRAGLVLAPPRRASPRRGATGIEQMLRDLTAEAGLDRQLRAASGRLEVGRHADMTVFEHPPASGRALVGAPGVETWIEGIPVSP